MVENAYTSISESVGNAYTSISESVGKLREFQKVISVQDFLVKEGLHDQGYFLSDLKTSMEWAKARFDKLPSEYFLDESSFSTNGSLTFTHLRKTSKSKGSSHQKTRSSGKESTTVVTKSRTMHVFTKI